MEFYQTSSSLAAQAARFNSQRDGILRWQRSRTKQKSKVSIPNGMEFYSLIVAPVDRCASFNSQRDGILPEELKKALIDPSCFNSQRDGILRMKLLEKIRKSMFQFPTGWNSTREMEKEAANDEVSIPNGMEFYVIENGLIKANKKSFNSQRDGILRNYICFLDIGDWNVSIPNGMEFYLSVSDSRNPAPCFNSQRDGILRAERRLRYLTLAFQFPTGWNSTPTASPNLVLPVSFNSQRDGILHFSGRYGDARNWFQFPTGWNSTYGVLSLLQQNGGFNSQRDGILLNNATGYVMKYITFQFPTGWNSTFYKFALLHEYVERFNSQRDGILRNDFLRYTCLN